VLGARGDHEVHGELSDGRRCYLPLGWTDRRPRREAEIVRGTPVRLTMSGLRALEAWIRGRKRSDEKFDSSDLGTEKGHDEHAERSATVDAVVGQARTSRAEGEALRSQRRPGQ
jgi:hypothetical protein